MPRVGVYLGAVLCLTWARSAPAQPPPPPPPPLLVPMQPARDTPKPTGTSVIRGRVMAADDQPLRKAIVTASSRANRATYSATTDASGRYELRALPAGEYSVAAAKTNYVRVMFGQQRPLGPGKPFELAAGQAADRVDFTLARAGVIVGRIFDEFNDPVADAQVMVMRFQNMQGTRRLMSAGRGASTNDMGEYRLFGLAPGEYYVSATLRNFMMGDTNDRSGYAATYYPGTGNATHAQRLTIASGQVVTNINIALLPVRAARISGMAFDSHGRPMEGVRVMAMPPPGTPMGGPNGAVVKADGSFDIGGVTPSEYTVRTNSGGPDTESPSAVVTVNGEDVTGVQLVSAQPSMLRGRLTFDAAAPKLTNTRVVATLVGGVPGAGNAVVKDDGTFEMRLQPGHAVLRLSLATPDWRLKSVRIGGADVTDTGFDIPSSGGVSEIVVELTNKRTEVSGLVLNASGQETRDAVIVLFAQDPERWSFLSRYIARSSPGPDRRYRTRLTPGEYYAVALPEVDNSEWNSPEFLARIREGAVTFSILEGESRVLDLKLSTPR